MTTGIYFEKLDRLETLFGHKVSDPPTRVERLRTALSAAVDALRERRSGPRRAAGQTSATSPS